MTSGPLTLAELAAALDAIGGFEVRPLIAVAVSGGPDSLALVLLAEKWARQRGGSAWALTVDHGLRSESAAEARTLAGWLAARAVPHDVMVWSGDKPASGIQEAARDARYHLMAEWCRTHGCLHLLAAHQREDQVETHLIRRRAGSGIDGLAGMSAVRELEGCRLVRPLLSVPRARLLALLADEGQPFLRDPSNRNPAFERARLRAAPEALGGTAGDALVAELRIYGRQRIGSERVLDALIAGSVALHPAGFGVIDMAAIAQADPETAERLLGRVAAAIGGARYPARRARLARLRAGLAAEPDRARTLGGCRFVPWRGRLLVLRELAAASAPVPVEPGARLMWDRRFAADLAPTAARGFLLGYLGHIAAVGTKHPIDSPEHRPMDHRAGDLPRLVHQVLPALWDDEGLVAVPHLGYCRPGVGALPRLSFRPANPLTSVGFTVV